MWAEKISLLGFDDLLSLLLSYCKCAEEILEWQTY
jgi:hypothetical protein